MHKKVVVFAGNDCAKEKEEYYYSLAYETGKLLATAGYVTVTGGGPGLMNQICKGAFEKGGEVIGICLNLPGRHHSPYVTHREEFDHLRPRQEKLLSLGDAFMAVPGGVGTLYEIFEVLALKRKNDIPDTKPLVLIDSYYDDLVKFIGKIEQEGFIQLDVNKLYQKVETPEQAIHSLKRFYDL